MIPVRLVRALPGTTFFKLHWTYVSLAVLVNPSCLPSPQRTPKGGSKIKRDHNDTHTVCEFYIKVNRIHTCRILSKSSPVIFFPIGILATPGTRSSSESNKLRDSTERIAVFAHTNRYPLAYYKQHPLPADHQKSPTGRRPFR